MKLKNEIDLESLNDRLENETSTVLFFMSFDTDKKMERIYGGSDNGMFIVKNNGKTTKTKIIEIAIEAYNERVI